MTAEEIAKRIIEQWFEHDIFRVPAGESKETPDVVILAKAYLALLENA